jgi:hypothetical protein
MSIVLGEVIETGKLTYNNNPKSKEGNILPLGSIKVRLIPNSDVENLEDTYARPITLNYTFTPLNGEVVMLVRAPSKDEISPKHKNITYYYLPYPINATDDSIINQLHTITQRTTTKESNTLVVDNPFEPGRTFPFPCRPLAPLQPYEGDLIIQNRGGSAIRLGMGTSDDSQYYKKPQHHKDTKLGDPTFAMTLEPPASPKKRPINEDSLEISGNKNQSKNTKSQKYRVENVSNNITGIFGGVSQKYSKVRLGRARRFETKGIPNFDKPQILIDTSRIVLNAKKDNIFLIAKDKVILEARKFYITTDEHDVDFDELVNRVQELAKELKDLTSAMAVFATPFGPTGPATNLLEVLRTFILSMRFELLPPNAFILPPEPRLDNHDFGINNIVPYAISRRLLGSDGGANDNNSNPNSPNINLRGFVSGQDSLGIQTRKDSINLLNDINSKNIELDYDPSKDLPEFLNIDCGLPLSGCGVLVDSNGNVLKSEGDGLTTKESPKKEDSNAKQLDKKTFNIKLVDSNAECKGYIYEVAANKFNSITGISEKVKYNLLLLLGNDMLCRGWYILNDSSDNNYTITDNALLTPDILADNSCLSQLILSKKCSEVDVLLDFNIKKLINEVKFN